MRAYVGVSFCDKGGLPSPVGGTTNASTVPAVEEHCNVDANDARGSEGEGSVEITFSDGTCRAWCRVIAGGWQGDGRASAACGYG
jgi:hypothetical protein